MGGKPSTSTPADMRLAENKAKAAAGSTGGMPSGFTSKPWDGSAARWPDAASYADSCLINLNTGPRSGWTKGPCKLPVREPNGDVNVNAVHAAAAALAGGRGGIQAPPAAKKAAAKKLMTIYGRMHADVPPAIKQMAQ